MCGQSNCVYHCRHSNFFLIVQILCENKVCLKLRACVRFAANLNVKKSGCPYNVFSYVRKGNDCVYKKVHLFLIANFVYSGLSYFEPQIMARRGFRFG